MKTSRKLATYAVLFLGISTLALLYRSHMGVGHEANTGLTSISLRYTYTLPKEQPVGVQQDVKEKRSSPVGKINCAAATDPKLLYTPSEEQLMAADTIDVAASYNTNRGNKSSYVLALNYGGQQGASVRGLGSLQCWVGSFGLPMDVVESFIPNSFFRSRVEGDPANMLKFSDFFDFDHYNSRSEEEGHAKLATWDEFLKTAPRNVVLVHTTKFNDELTWEAPTVIQTGATRKCYNIYKLPQGPQLSYLLKHGFCVVRIVSLLNIEWCLKYAISKSEHDAIFRGWKPEDVTVVFGEWGVRWYEPNPTLQNPDICKGISVVQLLKKLHPSRQLLKQAKRYEDMFLQPKSSVAIMLRLEHALHALWQMYASKQVKELKKVDYCVQEALTSVASKHTNFSAGKVFIAADVGKYGSTSWNLTYNRTNLEKVKESHLLKLVTDMLLTLYNNTWAFTEWEESFSQVTDGIEDGGYIAALQRVIASRADCLVLVGGGNFQILALQEYMKSHPDPSKHCIHLICINRDYEKDFSQFEIGFVPERHNRFTYHSSRGKVVA